MSLPDFEVEKHHIALAEVSASSQGYGFITSGSYSRGFRREKESEFQGVRYGGGDSLVNKPGVSSWTMDDFTGGAFQYVWGKDESMFARSKNALPSQFDRSIRSVPGLQPWVNAGRYATTETPLLVCAYTAYLYVVLTDRIVRFALSTGASSADVFGAASAPYHACFLRDRGGVFHSTGSTVSRYDLATFSGFSDTFSAPAGAVGDITGLDANGDRINIAYQDVLWSCPLPDDRTAPVDTTQFTRIGRLPGPWAASCWASGLLYILLAGNDTPTTLVAFDGTQILPIADFPYNFKGQSLCSYGGRIYVGGTGADIQTGAPRYAELYEVTGASLRLLKTFQPELLGAGSVYGTGINSMSVHEGLLFFGVKGLGLIAYDLTTDAFYGASNFSTADASADFLKLVSGRESLFSWVYPIAGHAGDGGFYRPATSQETVLSYTTEVETSDFAMAFDRKKRWRQLRVLTRYLNLTMTCEYSTNGGSSWTALSAPTLESSGRFQLNTFDLSEIPDSRVVRFKFGLPNGTDTTGLRELVAFTASFRILDSDAVGTDQKEKLAWTFVICGSETVEAADRTTLTQDVEQIHAQLWDWARGRTQLHYRDLDGEIYTVEIDTLEETQPVVLPELDSDGREAFYRVTLVEA